MVWRVGEAGKQQGRWVDSWSVAHVQQLIYIQGRWPHDTAGMAMATAMMATALTEVGRGGVGKEVRGARQEDRSMGEMWRAMVRVAVVATARAAVVMVRAAVATASAEGMWAG